jgi:phytol kinase
MIDWPRVFWLVGAVTSGWLVSGILKARGYLPCDIARKVNHVIAFAGGAVGFGWLPQEIARPSAYVLCVLLLGLVGAACILRDRAPFRYAFLANTRKVDAPHEAFYFWSSWVVSMAGLVAIDQLFADMVVTRTSALLVGIGDGLAEPVGRRLGRHRFRVPSLVRGKTTERSLEGSAAMAFGCFLTLLACFGPGVWAVAGGLALVLAAVEAVSPHGLDNLTLPLAASLLLQPMLSYGWL